MGAAWSVGLDAQESAAVAGGHVLVSDGRRAVCRRGRTKVQVRQVRVGPRLAGRARSVTCVGDGKTTQADQLKNCGEI